MKQLDSDDPFKMVDALRDLSDLRENAESVIPRLIQLFPDHRRGIRGPFPAPPENMSVSGNASEALISMGRPAVPYLIKSLESESVDIRSVAARTLGRIGHQAADAVPSLVHKCDDAETDVRKEAVKALGSIRARPKLVLPKLLPMATKEPDESARFQVVRSLGILDETGQDVTNTLVLALKDPSPDVRALAARSLKKYGAIAESAIPHLLESLADTDSRWEWYAPDAAGIRPVYSDVVDSLATLAEASPHRAPAIVRAMNTHANGQVRAGAALVMIRTSSKKSEALVALMRVLEEGQEGVERALEALMELKADGREAEASVLTFLEHDNRIIRFQATETLGAIGGEVGISALMETIRDDDEVVRSSVAAEALGNLGPNAVKAVPILAEAAVHPDTPRSFLLRSEAVQALGRIGPDARSALPTLLEVLNDKERPGDLRGDAATALSNIAPRDPEVLDALCAVLQDKPEWYAEEMCAAVAAALGKAGPAAESAVPLLTAILNNEFAWDETRASAARSLGQIGVVSEEVVSALSQPLREKRDIFDESPRRESAIALGVLRAKSALQILEKTSRDTQEDESVRKAAAEAVRLIQLPD